MYFTLALAALSRVLWVPFSTVGKKASDKKRYMIFEILPLLATACLSLCLIGWRQRWWWVARAVGYDEAIAAAKRETAPSTGSIAFCIGWGLLLTIGGASYLILNLLLDGIQGNTLVQMIRHIFRPNGWLQAADGRSVMIRADGKDRSNSTPTPDEIKKESFKILMRLRHVADKGKLKDLQEETILQYLRQAPLHVGNAVVGADQERVRVSNAGFTHTALLVLENLTIFPLQICIVTAVARLSGKLDTETFRSLKEIADVVIVLALVEIAVGLKNILWGVGGESLHKFDIPLCDGDVEPQRSLRVESPNGRPAGGEESVPPTSDLI